MPLSQPYSYDKGYISLNMPVIPGLPQTIMVKGHQLTLKSEFHISLIKATYAAELIESKRVEEIADEIVQEFEAFIAKQPLTEYAMTGEYRFVQLDVRKTVIGLATVPHLYEFFDLLRGKYKVDIPSQPTHITMYTLQPDKGIGILSEKQLEQDSEVVELQLS